MKLLTLITMIAFYIMAGLIVSIGIGYYTY